MKFLGIRFDKHTLGNALKNVAPALAFTPLGPLGVGAAAAIGGKLRGESTGQALKSGLSNAAIGSGAKLATGIAKGAILAHGAGASAGQIAGAVPSVLKDEAMGGADGLRAAGGFLKNNARTIADYGKMGEGIYDRMQENKAVGQANDRYRALQPYRDAALRELQAPTQDLSAVFADPTNPQGRYRRVNVGGY